MIILKGEKGGSATVLSQKAAKGYFTNSDETKFPGSIYITNLDNTEITSGLLMIDGGGKISLDESKFEKRWLYKKLMYITHANLPIYKNILIDDLILNIIEKFRLKYLDMRDV